MHLIINEIFYSIQGESSYAGERCIFVRTTACNLRCSWCDSEYTFNEGKKMSFDDIFETISQYDCNLIEVTGGEPLLQKHIYSFLDQLLAKGYEVLIETGGSLSCSKINESVTKIIDIKCPGSGMSAKNHYQNLTNLKRADQIKFVIKHRQDYEFAKTIIDSYKLTQKCKILMSPVHEEIEPLSIANWILEDNLEVKFQIQLHKYIWDKDQRGV